MRLYVVERHAGLELASARVDDARPGARRALLRAMHLRRGKPLRLARGLVHLARGCGLRAWGLGVGLALGRGDVGGAPCRALARR